jgi:hypothetical protein
VFSPRAVAGWPSRCGPASEQNSGQARASPCRCGRPRTGQLAADSRSEPVPPGLPGPGPHDSGRSGRIRTQRETARCARSRCSEKTAHSGHSLSWERSESQTRRWHHDSATPGPRRTVPGPLGWATPSATCAPRARRSDPWANSGPRPRSGKNVPWSSAPRSFPSSDRWETCGPHPRWATHVPLSSARLAHLSSDPWGGYERRHPWSTNVLQSSARRVPPWSGPWGNSARHPCSAHPGHPRGWTELAPPRRQEQTG